MSVSHSETVALTRALTAVSIRLGAMAYQNPDSPLADELRNLHVQLEDAHDTFVFGRPLKRWHEVAQ